MVEPSREAAEVAYRRTDRKSEKVDEEGTASATQHSSPSHAARHGHAALTGSSGLRVNSSSVGLGHGG